MLSCVLSDGKYIQFSSNCSRNPRYTLQSHKIKVSDKVGTWVKSKNSRLGVDIGCVMDVNSSAFPGR